tara:strand:+ start:266 stop:478 length:213 start_codon:yes stop_codon:yes gene_type:complete
MTDTTKYKSIIVRLETHAKLKNLAGKDRKISGVVAQLVDKEWKKEHRKASVIRRRGDLRKSSSVASPLDY